MQRIHVCLVSDQTIPNILAIEEFNPDELLMISTEQMEDKGKAGHILDCLAGRSHDYHRRHDILKVAEDSLLDCNRKLESWVNWREASEFVVNLTGGTKIMSIAAYEFFKDYASRMIYIPIPRNEYIMPFPKGHGQLPTAFGQRMSVKDYLTAYGLRIQNAGKLHDLANEARQTCDLARWMVAHYDNLKIFLGKIGETLRPHRKRREFALKEAAMDVVDEARELMERMGFVEKGNVFEKQLSKAEIQFLTGGWLEVYCFNEVSAFLGQGVYDAVIGIQIKSQMGTDNEFDVMFTKDNALYTVECKSLEQMEDPKTEALYKVGALQKDFGLRAHSFFVSTASNILGKNGALKPSIAALAEHLNTIVVAPNEVPDFRQVLSNELKINFKV